LLALPWFALVSARNPEFAHFFFIFQHFQRYLSRAQFDRYQPVWFFLPVLALGFLPWTTLLPQALRTGWRAARNGERVSSLLLIWAAFVLLFFSMSQSKLTPYIVPMLPALSLLTGRAIAELPATRFAAHLRVVAVIAAIIAAAVLALWIAPPMAPLVARASSASIAGFAIGFALLGLGCAVGARLGRRGSVLGAACGAGLGGLLLAQSGLLAADHLPRMRAVVDLTQQLRPWVGASTRLYCVNSYLQPVAFYLRHTCTLVGYRGELDFGLQQEPGLAIADLPQFASDWRQQADALAILRPEDFQQLEALGAPMRVIYTAPSFVAVIRR
jgi:4-amino-4-deoxy-L-arabinose transferase-like glycosyltransferase